MAAITWTETLALQQPRMDTTHREFVDLLNAVELALDGPVDALKAALDRFTEHTVEHFAQEDAWMAQLGFATENCHGFQHQSVLQVVQEVQRRLHADAADVALVRDLVPGLAQWPRKDSTAWVSASIPVAAVMAGGKPAISSGSSAAIFGTRRVSTITSLLRRCGSAITAATVTSEPVPAVVGTAYTGGGWFRPLK